MLLEVNAALSPHPATAYRPQINTLVTSVTLLIVITSLLFAIQRVLLQHAQ